MPVPYPRDDAWVDELPDVRRPGPSTPHIVRWRDRDLGSAATPIMKGVAVGPDDPVREAEVALYDRWARPGDHPVVLFPVAYGSLLGRVDQGDVVPVRGTPAAGRALALVVGDEIISAIGPARVPMWRRRRHRL